MDKDSGNTSGDILERFIKTIPSTVFGHPVYLLDWPGLSFALSGPYEECFNSDLALWVGVKNFSDGYYRLISMHKLWRGLGLRKIIVE